jgi:electron transport complex protein RnfB
VIVNECTGCDLCVAPCPVDCIDMLALPPQAPVAANDAEQRVLSTHWRERYYSRARRLEKQHYANIARRKRASASAAQLIKQAPSKPIEMGVWTPPPTAPIMSQDKAKADIAAAVARAKARKAALKKST